MTIAKIATITVTQSSCRTWPPNGPRHTRAKPKTSQETQKSLQKFLEPDRKASTDNSLEFGKAGEDLCWSHCTSTPHRSETNGIAEKGCRVKEGTSAVLLQSGLNESWWADSMECYTYLHNIQDLLSNGETFIRKTFWRIFQCTNHSIWSIGWVSPCDCEGPVKNPSIWIKFYLDCSLDSLCTLVEFGRVTCWLQTLRCWRRWTLRKSTQKDSMRKRWYFPNKENLFFQSQMDESKSLEEIRNWEHPPWYGTTQFEEKVTLTIGESEGSLPSPQDSLPDAWETINDFWFMSGNFIYRHHVEPRVKLYSPRGIIPYSTKLHWRVQNYSYELGCQARETHRWLVEYRWSRRLVRSLDRFHTIYSIRRETSRWIFVVRGEWQDGS